MEVMLFDDARDALISCLKNNMLIPIIGSGFTRGCHSYQGAVPSGEDYRQYMIKKIVNGLNLSTDEAARLQSKSFSQISGIYHNPKVASLEERKAYLRDNFSKVEIEKYKQDFLSFPWPYIYTLNIDDGIENGSAYRHVVYANRPVDNQVFDDELCVIKLHGDITDMLTYEDSDSEVFSQKQYGNSFKTNASLLKKFMHDSIYQNLIFVGCSLEDEIDLLTQIGKSSEVLTAKFYCTTTIPDALTQINLENYGITHCIVFESYKKIYEALYEAGNEAKKLNIDDLNNYTPLQFKQLPDDFEKNKSYLLFGKGLISKDHWVTLPYYFISRENTHNIIKAIDIYPIQIILGNGCSGKSYILADIAYRIRNREVLLFETKDGFTKESFQALLDKKNLIILADNNAFSPQQVELLLSRISELRNNNINIVMVANRNDGYLDGILKLYKNQGFLTDNDVALYSVKNKLTSSELAQINPLLTAIDAGIFNETGTIVDNIIALSDNLLEKNKYHKLIPNFDSINSVAALIALATERKIYSNRAVNLDVHDELSLHCKALGPLIDSESTWSFERSSGSNSSRKYVVNAEYWLCRQLETFAHTGNNSEIIVCAYRYLISQMIEQDGKPELLYGNKRATYRDYIMFDNINRIFCSSKSYGKYGLSLIRVIYEGLNSLLSVDPNYMHQRAKCYIKSSYYEEYSKEKIDYLDMAYRDANVALQVFSRRYEKFHNEKIAISMAHVVYTKALILCHQCNINCYSDIKANSNAIKTLYEAMRSPYNTYDFAKRDSFNYQNVIAKIVQQTIANQSLVDVDVHPMLATLFQIIQSAD